MVFASEVLLNGDAMHGAVSLGMGGGGGDLGWWFRPCPFLFVSLFIFNFSEFQNCGFVGLLEIWIPLWGNIHIFLS